MNAMNKAMIRDDQEPAATRNELYFDMTDQHCVFQKISTTLTVILESKMDEDAKNEALDLMISVLNNEIKKLNDFIDSLRATEVAQ